MRYVVVRYRRWPLRAAPARADLATAPAPASAPAPATDAATAKATAEAGAAAPRVFREVFLVHSPTTNELDFPAARPTWGSATRFVRVYASADVQVDEVELLAPAFELEHTSLRTLSTRGVWAVDADFESRGAIPPHVAGTAAVWFTRIAECARATWARARAHVRSGDVAPLAVYHGTTRAALAGIKARGFETAPGMLGTAAYVGTPWKAVRYASRTAAYVLRAQGDAVVVRAYLDAGRCKEFDGTGAACPCVKCVRTRDAAAERAMRHGWTPDFDRERTRVADHAGAWHVHEGFDTAHVPVVVATVATAAIGAVQFVSRNEEWAVARPGERLWAQSAALLDMETVARPNWDPEQRNQQIV